MRSNSGKDEGRDNLHDPTIRDRTEEKTKAEQGPHISHAKAPADHRESRKHH
jgi:hypothetical protein